MEKSIQINNKHELITTILNLERDMNCITKLHINVGSIGLIENKDLLYKVLSKADGLCKIYYEHKSILYEYEKLQWLQNVTAYIHNNLTEQNNAVDLYSSYKTINTINNQFKETIKEESYYISPITDITRFNKILKDCVTILNSKEDFKEIDYVFPITSLIHVLVPKQKDAIDTIYSIYNDKLKQHIGCYIFIFKCGKDWYTFSQEKYVHVSYNTNQDLDISGIIYKIAKGGK